MEIGLKSKVVCDDTTNIPRCFDGWCVVQHSGVGSLEWNPRKVGLHLEAGQENGQRLSGDELRVSLEEQKVFNSCALDWLMSNQRRIPRKWQGKHIFFWGTLYQVVGGGGDLYVRYLFRSGRRWRWSFYRLTGEFSGYDPCVVVL